MDFFNNPAVPSLSHFNYPWAVFFSLIVISLVVYSLLYVEIKFPIFHVYHDRIVCRFLELQIQGFPESKQYTRHEI